MYGCGGLLTQFLMGHDIEEEEDLDYILVLDTCPIDVTQMWGLDIANGWLILSEHHSWDNEITTHI